jgi:hypothetical protein
VPCETGRNPPAVNRMVNGYKRFGSSDCPPVSSEGLFRAKLCERSTPISKLAFGVPRVEILLLRSVARCCAENR